MAKIKAVRFKNLRSLVDTGDIELKPITILVGRNSAGKSTFARALPLIRQSCEEDKRAPILWYGRLVDFGDFKTSLNRGADDESIQFSFIVRQDIRGFLDSNDLFNGMLYFSNSINDDGDKQKDINVSLHVSSSKNISYASKIVVGILGKNCVVNIDQSLNIISIEVDDYMWTPQGLNSGVSYQQKLIPNIRIFRSFIKNINGTRAAFKSQISIKKLFLNEIVICLKQLSATQVSEDRLSNTIKNVELGSAHEIVSAILLSDNVPSSLKSKLNEISLNDPRVTKIVNLFFAASLSNILESVDGSLASYFEQVRYIEPLRATAQRYYRRQELAIDEIDPKGSNVAMFIDSLTQREMSSFNTWMIEHFGVEVYSRNEGGHVTLKIKHPYNNDEDVETNIADLGVGYSQILPVIIQLWSTANPKLKFRRLKKTDQKCLVVEQPELHLHPAYQAKIADVANTAIRDAKKNEQDLNIILETHSPNIINRFGELIEEGDISENDIQVLLFESVNENITVLKKASFDKSGILQNWPFGFLEP